MAIPVFELTPLTRGAASERRVVVKTVEMNRQTFFTLLAGIAPAVVITSLFWPFLGIPSLAVFALVEAAAVWLVRGRSSKGLRLNRMVAMRDVAKSKTGKFYVRGEEFDPLASTWVDVIRR